ncbi:hypothetical protein M758_11G104500 [Ceratodon purpureus]|nr:hypothetical protein M758_11G104500 [Ceratodon purpureus]
MGPFGGSQYSLCFFIPFHPKLPPPYDRVRPEVASLVDAWRGLGLTYCLLKGLKRTSGTLKLFGDTAEGYSKKDVPGTGTSGTSGIDKGSWGSLTARNPVSARPVTNQGTTGYRLRKLSRNAGQVSSPTSACKTNISGVCRGEQKDLLTDNPEHFSLSSLCETVISPSDDLRCLSEKSLKGFGLGLEGVMTTIRGLSQKAHCKSEVKEIFTVVKTADRVVEGVKVARGVIQTFGSPVGDVLHTFGTGGSGVLLGYKTVKIVLKGVKISKGLITVTKWCKRKHSGSIGAAADMAIQVNKNTLGGKRFAAIVKGLKASEGAVNVVRITKEVGRTVIMLDKVDHLLSWSVIMKGFKFTKSAIRVLEPLGHLPLGVISALGKEILEIKGTVEGLGVVIKAVALSRELYMVLLKGIGFTKSAMAAFNDFNRRSCLTKNSEEEYSQRTEVTLKGLCANQQPAMPFIIWSLSEAESKHSSNRWDFIEHSYSTKECFSIRTAETLRDVEDNSLLPLSFLMLANCFDSEPCLEIPNQSG